MNQLTLTKCMCGHVYNGSDWTLLKFRGYQEIPAGDGEPAQWAELRDCLCGSTIGRLVDPIKALELRDHEDLQKAMMAAAYERIKERRFKAWERWQKTRDHWCLTGHAGPLTQPLLETVWFWVLAWDGIYHEHMKGYPPREQKVAR